MRYGVAPDHLKVKNVENVSSSGGVGQIVSPFWQLTSGKMAVHELTSWYDFSVFCVGASTDRRLGIPGESLFGVYGGRSLSAVQWLSGYESHQFFQ